MSGGTRITDDDVSLDELLMVLKYAFVVEGNIDAIPMDRSKQLLHLVAATEEGIVKISLKKRD